MIKNRNLVFMTANDDSPNDHQYLILPNISTASLPDDGTSMEGAIAYDASQNKLVVYKGSAWETETSST